tara:strand:+ start:523 stop:672 length:150 start_codon:yes stop_codon:yes gene_type:complete
MNQLYGIVIKTQRNLKSFLFLNKPPITMVERKIDINRFILKPDEIKKSR